MAIQNIQLIQTGLADVEPQIALVLTNDTVETVTTTGYLNQILYTAVNINNLTMCLVSTIAAPGDQPIVDWYYTAYNNTTKLWTLNASGGGGDVSATLPTVPNRIAVYTNTTANIGDDATIAVNAGSLQAGTAATMSTGGVAGGLISYPSTSANAPKGSLQLVGVSNTGNSNTVISNLAMGQDTVIQLPDPSVPTTQFVLADGTQTINTILTTTNAITMEDTLFIIGSIGGNILLTGSNALDTDGGLLLYGTSNTTLTDQVAVTNEAFAQSTLLTIPDPSVGASTFLLADNATLQTINTGNFGLASGLSLIVGSEGQGTLQFTTLGGSTFDTLINTGNTLGQTTTISIPDPGTSVTTFILADSATGQTINSGSFSVEGPFEILLGGLTINAADTANSLIVQAIATLGQACTFTIPDPGIASSFFITQDNALGIQTLNTQLNLNGTNLSLSSGSPGTGSFQLGAQGNVDGDFDLLITNSENIAQDTTIIIPDPGSGDAGLLISPVFTGVVTGRVGSRVGGGSATNVISDATVQTSSLVIGNWLTQTTATPVLTITPGSGSFTIVSTTDPGTSTFSYIVIN